MKRLEKHVAVTHTHTHTQYNLWKGGTQLFKTVLLFFFYLQEIGGSKCLITDRRGDCFA